MNRSPGRKPSTDPPVRLVVHIPLSMRERLVTQSAGQHQPMSELVRQALAQYLEEGAASHD